MNYRTIIINIVHSFMSTVALLYFLVFVLFLTWVLTKIPFTKNVVFSTLEIRLIFLLKVLTGIGLSLLYTHFYGSREYSDTFKFFDDALVVSNHLYSDPLSSFKLIFGIDMNHPKVLAMVDQMDNWFKMYQRGVFNDNQTIIRFNAVVLLFSFGNYYIHLALINFIALLGLLKLVHYFQLNGLKNKWVAVCMLCFPQLLFWSSGLLKEGLLFSVFGWLLFYFHQALKFPNWKNVAFFGLFFYLSLLIKSYVLLSLLLPFVFLVIRLRIKQIHPAIIASGLGLLSFVLIFCLDVVLNLGIPDRIYQKQHDFINVAHLSNAGSYFKSFVLDNTWMSLLIHAPEAFWNTLTRPYIWQANNFLVLGASIENIFVVFLVVLMLVFPKKSFFRTDIFYFSLLFVVILFVIVGWVTPIAGALVRYKIPALPFVFFILYTGINWLKIKRKLTL